jgi:hypothetical protein
MTEDARFEDGLAKPLNLGALDAEDLAVISALVQDAVLPVTEIRWQAGKRRLALLINRLRREEGTRDVERVQSLLFIENVLRVASQGVNRSEKDLVLQVLSLEWQPGADADGALEIVLAGDGVLRAEVEALEVGLRDVTRPYLAPSRRAPDHG